MAVDKRTVLNENRERVHVRWTAKRGNEIDLIGQRMWRDSSVIPGGQQGRTLNKISLRKPKVFALQILRRYLTKEGRVRKFSTVYMDKRTLRSKI